MVENNELQIPKKGRGALHILNKKTEPTDKQTNKQQNILTIKTKEYKVNKVCLFCRRQRMSFLHALQTRNKYLW